MKTAKESETEKEATTRSVLIALELHAHKVQMLYISSRKPVCD